MLKLDNIIISFFTRRTLKFMSNNSELIQIGRDVINGRYVLKNTLFLVAGLVFVLGLFVGSTLSGGTNTSGGNPQAQNTQAAGPQTVSKEEHDANQFKFEDAIRKNPTDPTVYVQLGNFHFDHGEPQKAVDAYEKSLAISPNAPNVIVDCGSMYRELGQYNKALEYFNKAISLDKKHQNAMFNKGIVLYNDLNKKSEALVTWKELMRLNPSAKVANGMPIADFIKEHE